MPQQYKTPDLWMRTSALRYSVAGEAVVQEVGERQWQVQQRRELFGVERDQNRAPAPR